MRDVLKKMAALFLLLALTVSFAACGKGGNEIPAEAGDRTVVYFQASYVTAQVQNAYKEMVDTYNKGQGITDDVYVQMLEKPGSVVTGLDSALRGNYQHDVLLLNDDEFKTLAMQGGNYFLSLDSYLTDEVKAAMQWEQIPDALVKAFSPSAFPDTPICIMPRPIP